MLRVLDQGVVVASQNNPGRPSNCFGAVCVLANGTWVVSYRNGTRKTGYDQQPMLIQSCNRGKTWSDPVAPFGAPSIEKKLGTFHSAALTSLDENRLIAVLRWVDATDPSIPWFNPKTDGLLDTRLMLAESFDSGRTWSRPRLVDVGRFSTVPVSFTGPMTVMPDGRWACPFETNKNYEDTEPWEHAPVLTFSSNQGKTWEIQVVVQQDSKHCVFYWDQRLTVLNDSSLLNLFWTYNTVSSSYLNIHASRSTDAGRTWSPAWDTGVPGHPAPPVMLPDGRLVMVYVDRAETSSVQARVSHDGGRTWPEDTQNTIFQSSPRQQDADSQESTAEAWSQMEQFATGLPDATVTADGEVLLTYYSGFDSDHTDIHWAILECMSSLED